MDARDFLKAEGIEQARFDIRNVDHVIELMEKWKNLPRENGYPKERQHDDDIEVHLENGDVCYLSSGEVPGPFEEFDSSQIITLAGAPFMYSLTSIKQAQLMDALALAAEKTRNADYIISYLNKMPV